MNQSFFALLMQCIYILPKRLSCPLTELSPFWKIQCKHWCTSHSLFFFTVLCPQRPHCNSKILPGLYVTVAVDSEYLLLGRHTMSSSLGVKRLSSKVRVSILPLSFTDPATFNKLCNFSVSPFPPFWMVVMIIVFISWRCCD